MDQPTAQPFRFVLADEQSGGRITVRCAEFVVFSRSIDEGLRNLEQRWLDLTPRRRAPSQFAVSCRESDR
jgi:hypothetical protein